VYARPITSAIGRPIRIRHPRSSFRSRAFARSGLKIGDFRVGTLSTTAAIEAIAPSADSHQMKGRFRIAFDFASKLSNVDVDGSRLDVFRSSVTPHFRKELLATDRSAWMPMQIDEDLDFLSSERQGLELNAYRSDEISRIDPDVISDQELKDVVVGTSSPPEHCLRPERELADRERLSDIIVSAQRQPSDDVVLRGLCGEEDHRLLRFLFFELVTNSEAVQSGQHHVH